MSNINGSLYRSNYIEVLIWMEVVSINVEPTIKIKNLLLLGGATTEILNVFVVFCMRQWMLMILILGYN